MKAWFVPPIVIPLAIGIGMAIFVAMGWLAN